MVKCLECGFEGPRLQWTHFKYNCSGKFNNGTEYKQAYPGAKIVSDDVARSTAITLSNFIKKYGDIEGNIKWNLYKEKQAISNSYEYKRDKHGWSKDQFDGYNSSRAQTLEKMIERHGEITGAEKWEQYCLRQGYTNTKEYFIKKYGTDIGIKKYLEINHKKLIPHSPVLLARQLGITQDEAVNIILSRSTTFYFSKLESEFTTLLELEFGKLDHTSGKHPFGLWSEELNTYVVYDIKHGNCVIEFNGDYWHANPDIYVNTAIIRGKSVLDIRHRDMLKLKTAKNRGLSTYVVWENEFKTNKVETIKKVIEWISNEQKLKV